jgi:hypothetical protein
VFGSVSSGLPCGHEGPMIHSGAIVGAGVSQGKSSTMGFDTSFLKFQVCENRPVQVQAPSSVCTCSHGGCNRCQYSRM